MIEIPAMPRDWMISGAKRSDDQKDQTMKARIIFPAIAASLMGGFRPFEGDKKAGWKTVTLKDDEGNEIEAVALKDGNPIWVDVNGQETTLGGDTVARLNREAKDHREAKEAAETKLKAFEGIDDPAAAKKALETVKNIDQKKLIDAGEVERVKSEIAEQFKTQLEEKDTALAEATKRADSMLMNNAFNGSKFIKDKIAIPADIVQKTFGENFKIEDGKLVAYGSDGNKLLSKTKQGEYADFDEAIEIIVDGYASKDAILKGNNHAGSGNNGGGGGGTPGTARYSRGEFDKLNPTKQAEIAKLAGEGKAEIYDDA